MTEAYPNNGTIKRTVFYLKSHFRRPVSTSFPLVYPDYQSIIPLSWCPRCGKEIFDEICSCSKYEGAMYDE